MFLFYFEINLPGGYFVRALIYIGRYTSRTHILEQNLPLNGLENLAQNGPQNMQRNMPEIMPRNEPENFPQNGPQNMPQIDPENLRQNGPEDMQQNEPEEMPQNVPENMLPNEMEIEPRNVPENGYAIFPAENLEQNHEQNLWENNANLGTYLYILFFLALFIDILL